MEIEITITGTTPLLCNRFTDEAMMKASRGTSNALTVENKTPMEVAEPKLYLGADKKPVIPQPNIFRCILDAGKFFKAGKSKVTTQKSSLIPACVEIRGVDDPVELLIVSPEPWHVDTRSIVNPTTGGRRPCHRPRFDVWELSFIATIDTELISEKLFREIVDAAGRRIGLGDFRPDRKGPFGKFVVTRWHVVEEAAVAAE